MHCSMNFYRTAIISPILHKRKLKLWKVNMFAHNDVLYIGKECFWIQAMKVLLFFFFNHPARNQKADNTRTGSMIQPDGNASWGPGIFLFSDSWSEDKYNGFTHLQMQYRKKSRWLQNRKWLFPHVVLCFSGKSFPRSALEASLYSFVDRTYWEGRMGKKESYFLSFSVGSWGEKRKLGKPVGWAKHVSATGGLQELEFHASLSGLKGYIPFINLCIFYVSVNYYIEI